MYIQSDYAVQQFYEHKLKKPNIFQFSILTLYKQRNFFFINAQTIILTKDVKSNYHLFIIIINYKIQKQLFINCEAENLFIFYQIESVLCQITQTLHLNFRWNFLCLHTLCIFLETNFYATLYDSK